MTPLSLEQLIATVSDANAPIARRIDAARALMHALEALRPAAVPFMSGSIGYAPPTLTFKKKEATK